MVNKLLSVKEASEYLGVSPTTIYRLKRDGKIPYIQKPGIGIRLKLEDLGKWLDESSYKPCSLTPDLLRNKSILNNLLACDISEPGGESELPKGKSKTRYNLGFGAIYQRKTKKGIIRWYLDYQDENGKRIQKLAKMAITKEEAVLALREKAEGVFKKAHGIIQEKKAGFNEFAELYLENYARTNKKSWECDEYSLNAHLKPYFGSLDLREITPLQIEAYRAERLKAGMKRSSTNREMALLKKMFNLAIDWGYCSQNPGTKVKLFSEKDNLKERILTDEEEARLLEKCLDTLKLIIITALHTGMRRNEILNLKWEDIDLKERQIKATKTKSGKNRIVPIDDVLFEVLEKLRVNNRSEYVFENPETGQAFKSIRKGFSRACQRAEIKDLRFHDLRHTFASRLIRGGADIISIQKLLGHFSVTVTQRYIHTEAAQLKEAVAVLCRKDQKEAENRENLLHICDTDRKEKGGKDITPLFSIN